MSEKGFNWDLFFRVLAGILLLGGIFFVGFAKYQNPESSFLGYVIVAILIVIISIVLFFWVSIWHKIRTGKKQAEEEKKEKIPAPITMKEADILIRKMLGHPDYMIIPDRTNNSKPPSQKGVDLVGDNYKFPILRYVFQDTKGLHCAFLMNLCYPYDRYKILISENEISGKQIHSVMNGLAGSKDDSETVTREDIDLHSGKVSKVKSRKPIPTPPKKEEKPQEGELS